MTLQALHGFSDRETAEAVRFDLRWKLACGLSLDDPGIHPTSLVVWRRRVARSGRPHRVNDAVRRVIGATGILAGRRRRAVDSTILADAVASQDTVTQLIAAMRRVMREVPGAAGVIAARCTGFDYDKGRRPVIGWSDPKAAEELVSALVNDAGAVVAALRDAELGDGPAAALALLAATAGQDVEGRGQRRHRRAVADRAHGGRGPDHLPGRPGIPACPQELAYPHRRVPGAPVRRAATGSSPMRT